MNFSRAIIWVFGHALIIAALFKTSLLAFDNTGAGYFALPLAFGIFQSVMLRRHIRPWLWPLATVVGFFASFLFLWIFGAVIGFTMSFTQSFLFRTQPRFITGVAWTLLGAAGWLIGLLFGGDTMPDNDADQGMTLYIVTSLIYSAFLLPIVIQLEKKASAAGKPQT